MKPGDLVTPREHPPGTQDRFVFLYGCGVMDAPWDESGRMIPTDIPYREGEIGVVLGLNEHYIDRTYVKLLTPSGVGWVRKLWLRVIDGSENLPPPVVR